MKLKNAITNYENSGRDFPVMINYYTWWKDILVFTGIVEYDGNGLVNIDGDDYSLEDIIKNYHIEDNTISVYYESEWW